MKMRLGPTHPDCREPAEQPRTCYDPSGEPYARQNTCDLPRQEQKQRPRGARQALPRTGQQMNPCSARIKAGVITFRGRRNRVWGIAAGDSLAAQTPQPRRRAQGGLSSTFSSVWTWPVPGSWRFFIFIQSSNSSAPQRSKSDAMALHGAIVAPAQEGRRRQDVYAGLRVATGALALVACIGVVAYSVKVGTPSAT